MSAILLTGFLIGLRHALDADHMAALASLAGQARSWRKILRLGMAWGAGHATTLFFVSAVVLSMDTAVPEQVSRALEALVGALLVLLGLDVIRRALRQRVHCHTHRHGSRIHFHLHTHDRKEPGAQSTHDHRHGAPGLVRAMTVGSIQGLAGSAALVLLSLTAIKSLWLGIGYVLIFGFGTLLGMALLSFVIAWPLQLFSHRWTRYGDAIMGGIGAVTIYLGTSILVDYLAGIRPLAAI